MAYDSYWRTQNNLTYEQCNFPWIGGELVESIGPNYDSTYGRYFKKIYSIPNQYRCWQGYSLKDVCDPVYDEVCFDSDLRCTLTANFLNSSDSTIFSPVNGITSRNSSTTEIFNLNNSGGVRKIKTQLTCTGVGTKLSNETSTGVKFTNTIVKFR